jgi:thiol:disulfide interchange protein DsbD
MGSILNRFSTRWRAAAGVALLMGLAATASADTFNATESLAKSGLLLTAFYVFLGGVLVSITPCLYPMIPITLSAIGARNAGAGFFQGFSRSFVFVLGIAVVYTALGLFAALTGSSISRFLGLWWVWAGMSALFFVMGLSMMGMFSLELPPALAGKLQGKVAGKQGFLGAFLLGLVTGVVASPCGSPVLASVLLMAATAGQAVTGGFLLLSYAFGIGLLFLVLGTFPSLLTKMPRSGGWMEDVKKLLGAVLIGVSLYYLQFARVPDAVYWPLVLAAGLGGAMIIAVRAGLRKESPLRFGLWRGTAVVLAAFSIWVAVAKVPAALISVPTKGTQGSSAQGTGNATFDPASALGQAMTDADGNTTSGTATAEGDAAAARAVLGQWLTSEAEGLAAGRALGLPVMVDIRADWCAACIELEKKTFSEESVKQVFAKGFVTVKLDATDLTPEMEAIQKKYRSVSLPTVAFVDADGKIRHEHTLYQFETAENFLKRLEAVAAKK